MTKEALDGFLIAAAFYLAVTAAAATVLYFVIRLGVRSGIQDAVEITERQARAARERRAASTQPQD